jgi:hypothetical protein
MAGASGQQGCPGGPVPPGATQRPVPRRHEAGSKEAPPRACIRLALPRVVQLCSLEPDSQRSLSSSRPQAAVHRRRRRPLARSLLPLQFRPPWRQLTRRSGICE